VKLVIRSLWNSCGSGYDDRERVAVRILALDLLWDSHDPHVDLLRAGGLSHRIHEFDLECCELARARFGERVAAQDAANHIRCWR
jgi:hypothetical protein